MKVLHLTYADNGGAGHFFAEALRSHYPAEVRSIRMRQTYIDYPVDLLGPGPDEIAAWIDWADILHIHDHALAGIWPKGKPAVMHYHGTTYRRMWQRYKAECEARGFIQVVSTQDMTLIDGQRWLPTPRPAYLPATGSEPFRACHAPTNREIKSSDMVIEAARLAEMPLDLIEGQTYQGCIEQKRQGNLLIDQFKLGYGSNAIEAWAMGLPVICYADGPILAAIREILGYFPFCPVAIRQLPSALKRFRDDEDFYWSWAEQGRRGYAEWHSYSAVARKTLEVYDQILPGIVDWSLYEPDRTEISVVIPCFGYSHYLPEAIESVKAQTWPDVEIVIVNDADPEFNLAKEYSRDCRVIHLAENRGTAGALNAGIEAARGQYIAILSADDRMKPERLEIMLNYARQYPHSFVYDDLAVFGSEAHRLLSTRQINGAYVRPVLAQYDFDYVLNKNGIGANLLYPKQAWREAGGYREAFRDGREDWAFNVALGAAGWCGVHVPQALYEYRREPGNRTNRNKSDEWKQTFARRMRETFGELYEGYRPMGCCGKGKNGTEAASRTRGGLAMASLPGAQEGFVQVEYLGSSSGNQTFWVGQQRYVFSTKRRVGYVAKEHLAAILDKAEFGQKLFREMVSLRVPALSLTEETVPAKIEVASPGDFTVSELKLAIPDLTTAERSQMLANEQAGRNRTSIIDALSD